MSIIVGQAGNILLKVWCTNVECTGGTAVYSNSRLASCMWHGCKIFAVCTDQVSRLLQRRDCLHTQGRAGLVLLP